MDRNEDLFEQTVARALDNEIGLVRAAVAMVAYGHSTRVTVAGLRLGDQIIGPARRLASGLPVRVVPLWQLGDSVTDIAVERVSDD